MTRLAAEVAQGLGPIDILVNNAGNNIRGATHELSEADWDSVLDTNLKGPFLCSRAIGPEMVKRGWGRIINMGSIMSVIALPGRAPYASAKAGVANLTRALALEWAGTGVTVNAICPGPFGTEMNRALLNDPVEVPGVRAQHPAGPLGRAGRAGGHRRAAGFGRVVVHDRQLALRGRRLDGALRLYFRAMLLSRRDLLDMALRAAAVPGAAAFFSTWLPRGGRASAFRVHAATRAAPAARLPAGVLRSKRLRRAAGVHGDPDSDRREPGGA